MYYDMITCPQCLYSATSEMFPKMMYMNRRRINSVLEPYMGKLTLSLGKELDTQAIFAGYYLAILCARHCFPDYEIVIAGLWLKISRMYEDCKDNVMVIFSAKKAQEAYLSAYSRLDVSPDKVALLNLTIGALSHKIGDYRIARDFLYKAKIDKNAPHVLREKADLMIDEIREYGEE